AVGVDAAGEARARRAPPRAGQGRGGTRGLPRRPRPVGAPAAGAAASRQRLGAPRARRVPRAAGAARRGRAAPPTLGAGPGPRRRGGVVVVLLPPRRRRPPWRARRSRRAWQRAR